ncbi:MAG: POTRA domain-containing protein [Crocinitomicaceae bacterium]|nr:POTRA domain-containing protein [Crocinitomicaceae bacterium]
MIRIVCLFLLTLCFQEAYSQQIKSISFAGLTITKEDYLRDIISCKESGEFMDKQFKDDIFLLRNLNLFFQVEGSAETTDSVSYNLTFTIREANYLYPIISISGFDDQLKLQLGANHINFLGRAQSIGALYQFYDRHSLSLFHTAKRHSNQNTGHEFALAKYSTIEPLYFADSTGVDTVSSFNFDNYSVSVGGHYWLGRYTNAGIGAAYMYEDYSQRDDAFDLFGQKRFNFNKHQLRLHVETNRVEYLFERLEGWKARVYGEWIKTYSDNAPSFLKLQLSGSYYKLVGERGNLAASVRIGTSSNEESPFAPFVLDGFLNVRGIGNRVERGTAEIVVNGEYRHSLWLHKYVTLQSAAFFDYGALREAGKSFNTFFDDENPSLFLGAGLRFNLNILYKTCIRIDYSVNPFDPSQRGFTFGFGQFF